MFDTVRAQGIVLDTSLIKEYDKRLVILTVELGKITVFANGARRKNSPLTAASQRFVMGEFELRPSSQNTYSLISVDVEETFIGLSYDIECLAYASYATEVASYFTEEAIGAGDELNLLYVTFKTILDRKVPLSLIKPVFECKLLDIEGVFSEDELVRVNHNKFSDDASFVVRYVLSRNISETFSFNVGENVINEFNDAMNRYIKTQCDKHFNSLDILGALL